jgi:hypothetical protein
MFDLQRTKHRVRLLQLLIASERAALAPIALDKLHAFAYLADILSPVWHLRPFEDRIGRTGKPPYYPDLQRQLDLLVAMGLVEPSELDYVRDAGDLTEIRFTASYSLRTQSARLAALTNAFEDDEELSREQVYLNALAEALASLPDEDIAIAASKDLAYQRSLFDTEDYLDLDRLSKSLTSIAVDSFDRVFPGVKLTPSRRLYMYANYLGKRAHG